MSPPQHSSLPAWYVFSTEPRKEKLAMAAIERTIGLPVLLPTYSARKNRSQETVELMFPGYLFVCCDIGEYLRWIAALQGVRRAVQFGARIPSIPNQVVEYLSHPYATEAEECIGGHYRAGDQVAIMDGPFAGFLGVVCEARTSQSRVQVLLDFLSTRVKIVVAENSIETTGSGLPKGMSPLYA